MNSRGWSPKVAVVVLVVMVVVGLAFAGSMNFGLAQTPTTVNGIIYSDTTWTKTNSPYMLTGPVAINKDVTLTIEPGTTVSLNDYYIKVEGTLRAKGTNANKIYLGNGRVYFWNTSSDWNEVTGSGSIIENAILTSSIEVHINDTSPKINKNSISGWIDCEYSSSIISNNDIEGAIRVSFSYTVISGNTIHNGAIGVDCSSDYRSIISNNTISGGETGIISAGARDATISNNVIRDCAVGIDAVGSTIEQNVITNNGRGVLDRSAEIILNNTIVNNTVGVYTQNNKPIVFNNIHNNSEYNIRLDKLSKYNVNATYNWWGTTDVQAINQSIHDFKNDFNLGNVTFIPFLTEPNPQAGPNTILTAVTPSPTSTSATTPTPNQSANPSPSPSVSSMPTQSTSPSSSQNPEASPAATQTELHIVIGVLATAVVALTVAVAVLLRRARKTNLEA